MMPSRRENLRLRQSAYGKFIFIFKPYIFVQFNRDFELRYV